MDSVHRLRRQRGDPGNRLDKGTVMAIQFKVFKRPAFSGDTEELKKKVTKYCNRELGSFRIISISEAKGISDDFYRITVWYDDEAERFEHLMSSPEEADDQQDDLP
jgi:hypothetical protein